MIGSARLAVIGWVIGMSVLFAGGAPAAETEESPAIVVSPRDGEIGPGSVVTFVFPDGLAAPGEIGGAPERPVLHLAPDAGLEMRWKSATELTVRFQERVRPGAEYVFPLADGVADKLGVPSDWSARFAARPLLVSRSDVWDGNQSAVYARRLDREPSIAVRTTYPVRFEDVAKLVSFRAVKSGQRRPASVFFSGEEAVGTFFSVRAREPLPVGETWDLLIEGLSDAGTGTALPHPVVLPAGSTRPLEIDWIGGFNHPLEKPVVRIEFSEPVRWDSVTASSVRVEPPVKGFKARAENRQVIVEGEFDRTVRYAVRVTGAVVGQSGFGLAKEERWGVTFRAKRPNLLFPPSSEAFFPSGSGMRFPAVQVNSPEIRWRLAEVPLAKVGVLRERLREYQADAKDPLSGELVRDARTGWWRQKPTERFIEGFGLRVAAEGRFPATTGDEEVEREMQWTPEGPARGVYLLEAEGRLADGAWIGNRALIYFSDLVVSEISSADRYAVRVSGMADGAPVAGATVRMFSRDPIGAKALSPRPGAVSPNGASAGWYDADIARIESFVVSGLPASAEYTALVRGSFRELDGETRRDRRGFRIERVMTNLSGADRVGTADHPVKIGDRLLVTWRVRSERLHHYVALEDGLPAGLETINPDLALIAKTFDLPAPAADERLLNRSHQELRDDVTNLYFDEVRSGPGVYSVLARATSAGVFAWPAAQIVPMYDSRFGGLSAAGVLHVVD